MIKTIFFDLDDTLYPRHNGIWAVVLERIEAYMREHVGIADDQVPVLRSQYAAQYGTTLRGLLIDYAVDPDDYLEYVHAVAIEDMLQPDAELEHMLARLPQQKWVFTNASLAHARRVLKALGVGRHFHGIFSIESMGYLSKPDASVYPLALQAAGNNLPESNLYLDDRLINLVPAQSLGMATVLVGDGVQTDGADHHIQRVDELIDALPWLVE